MCGICGILGKNDQSEIRAMMAQITHRGPEGSGWFSDEQFCALGHQRLAIIDLSDLGRQPMSNESATVVSVTNGAIYNYKDVRSVLRSYGHTFRSNCDCEVIPHAYEQFGEAFPRYLRGMFAIALYDRIQHKLILARDPIGEKPLYYWQLGNRVAFASEIKAIFAAGAPAAVNYKAIPSWLMYQYSLGEDTLFHGIHKVPAGHMATWSALHNTAPYIRSYWGLAEENKQMRNGERSAEQLHSLLDESTKLRLQSDVPVGAFLSGGIDSSAVVALYRKISSGTLHTFTASFETHSEAEFARKVSQSLETEYHEVPISSEMVARDIRKVTWHHDEPLGDAATLCNYYLAKEAKKYVSVVLAGEGGDELFGGYPWHRYAAILETLYRMPAPLRKAAGKLISANPAGKFYRWHRILSLLNQDSLNEALIYPTTAMSKGSAQWLLGSRNGNYPVPQEFNTKNVYDRMLASDVLNLLPEKFMMKADKAVMAWAIEERLPLLDKNIVRFAFRLTPGLKRDKWVLRKAVEGLLPEEIVWRPKQGFGTPVAQWLEKGPLHDMALDTLSTGKLLREVCTGKSLSQMTSLLLGKSNNHGRLALDPIGVIWGLFALQTWHDVWFGTARERKI